MSILVHESIKLIESLLSDQIQLAERNPNNFEIIYNYPPGPALSGSPINSKENEPDISGVNIKGLYVHIPFCPHSCSYCHYTRKIPDSDSEIDIYLDYLIKELRIWVDRTDNSILKNLRTVYFGGGTPTMLSCKQIERIHETLSSFIDFNNLIEYTWESSPTTITEEKLEILRKCGINRISLGIQSMKSDVLEHCSRDHLADQALEAYKWIRQSGFDNVNIDLIYGFPENIQSTDYWEQTLNSILSDLKPSPPESISIHQLRLKTNTALYDKNVELPTDKVRLIQLAMAHITFKEAKYVPIENDIFIKDPLKHRHFHQQDKWCHFYQHLGIGLASYGYVSQNHLSYFNTRSISDYYKSVDNGVLPFKNWQCLGETERKERMMVMGLTFFEGISKELWYSEFGEKEIMSHPSCDQYREVIDKLIQNGYLIDSDKNLRLSTKGGFYSKEIRQMFFGKRYRDKQQYFNNFNML